MFSTQNGEQKHAAPEGITSAFAGSLLGECLVQILRKAVISFVLSTAKETYEIVPAQNRRAA